MATFERKAHIQLDKANFEVLIHALEGNFRPLADHIESGGALTPELRGITVSALRGKITKPPHRKRTLANRQKEVSAIAEIYEIATRAKADGRKMNKSRAVDLYLDANPDARKETILKWIENWEIENVQNFTALIK